jgi:hypothetical protein
MSAEPDRIEVLRKIADAMDQELPEGIIIRRPSMKIIAESIRAVLAATAEDTARLDDVLATIHRYGTHGLLARYQWGVGSPLSRAHIDTAMHAEQEGKA